MVNEEHRQVVRFYAGTIPNSAASKKEGRPIHEDIEICEIRTGGDRNCTKVFPAHTFHRWVTTPDGNQEQQTYAQRWNDQYRRFKELRTQVQEGTPIEELPFLTAAKRNELKALSIHTAETLAALDGNNLKSLGMGGRELKNQAQAYLDNASGSADATAMASEIAALRRQIEEMNGASHVRIGAQNSLEPVPDNEPEAFEAMTDDAIKQYIADKTGEGKPRGNPSRDTLVTMARELAA